jgi:uncharacterized small protein (DUF1192 family)
VEDLERVHTLEAKITVLLSEVERMNKILLQKNNEINDLNYKVGNQSNN